MILGDAGSKVVLGFDRSGVGSDSIVLERRVCPPMAIEESRALMQQKTDEEAVHTGGDDSFEAQEEAGAAALAKVVEEAAEEAETLASSDKDSNEASATDEKAGAGSAIGTVSFSEGSFAEASPVKFAEGSSTDASPLGATPSSSPSKSTPPSSKASMRGSKRRLLAAVEASRTDCASESADDQAFERAASVASMVSYTDQVLQDMSWLTFLIFVCMLFASAKIVGLTPEAATVFAQLVCLWIGMMVCLFALTALDKAVTRSFRPRRKKA